MLDGEGSSKKSLNAGKKADPLAINKILGSILFIVNFLSADVVTSPSLYLSLIKESLSIIIFFSSVSFVST